MGLQNNLSNPICATSSGALAALAALYWQKVCFSRRFSIYGAINLLH
jgi:hypothetical protein